MKIIDEKGRIFKTINIVDFLVVLAIFVAVLAIGVKLFAAPLQEAISPSVKMTTTVRLRGVTEYIQEELERNPLDGKQLVSGTDYINAYIVDVYMDDYENQSFNAAGEIVSSIDPVKKDYVITIESYVASGSTTLSIGTQEVRTGRSFLVKTRDFEMAATVETVIVDDGNN